MANVYLQYLELSKQYNSLCQSIGLLLYREKIDFDFDNNCIRFYDDSALRVCAKWISEVSSLRANIDKLGDLFDGERVDEF